MTKTVSQSMTHQLFLLNNWDNYELKLFQLFDGITGSLTRFIMNPTRISAITE